MPRPSSRSSSRRGKRKKKKIVPFIAVNPAEIINPFGNVVQAKRARQKLYETVVRNQPHRVKKRPNGIELEKKGVPAVADIDDWLIETHDNVFTPIVLPKGQKPNPGLEFEGGKIFTALEGARLNKLSPKELLKLVTSISKHKRKETVTEGIAVTERDFLLKQLALVEAQLKAKKAKIDMMERETLDLDDKHKFVNKVYNEKLKYTMSEQHQVLFNTKIDHLDLHLNKQKRYWRMEKEKYEKLLTDAEEANYDKQMLDHVNHEIELDGMARKQIAKEDYLMCLQTKIDNFENYMTDTQADVDIAIKAHVKMLDAMKRKNFESLIANQDKSISEMRKFFQGVNTANGSIIHQLKNEVNARRFKLDRLERDLCLALEEHAKFSIPLQTTTAETKKYEKILEDAEAVRNMHNEFWVKAKKIEEQVLRLRWKKEIEEVKFEKAKEEYDQLKLAYSNAMLDVARKVGVALMVHSNTYSTLKTEAEMYEISHLVMQHFSTMDPKGVLQRDSQVQQYFEKQEADIIRMKGEGVLLKRKYDANRDAMYALFEKQFLRPLSTTGFQIPKLESTIFEGLTMYNGISDDQLAMLGLETSSPMMKIPCVV